MIQSIPSSQGSAEVPQLNELKNKRELLQTKLLQQLKQQQMIQIENQTQGKGLNLDIVV